MELDIADPIHGRIDVGLLAPLVQHWRLQLLNRVKQLGGLIAIFPSATHTRFAHVLGTFHIVSIRVRWLLQLGLITPEEALAVQIVALTHDIGHRAFSHLIELLVGDHDEYGLHLIRTVLADIITELGADIDLVMQIFQRKHPLADLVFHTPLGADKVDYLVRDKYYAVGGILDLRDFHTLHLGWTREEGLWLHSRGLPAYGSLLDTYYAHYVDIYLRASGRIAQRYLQRLIWAMLEEQASLRSVLDTAGEDELMGRIAQWSSRHKRHPISQRYALLAARQHPRKAFLFSERPLLTSARSGQGHAALACGRELLDGGRKWLPAELSQIEDEIATELGLAAVEVSVARAPSRRTWKVREVPVRCVDGSLQPISGLLPELQAKAEIYAQLGVNLVVGLSDRVRARLAHDMGAHQRVREILMARLK